MNMEFRCRMTLDTEADAEIIEQYRQDKRWKICGIPDKTTVFEIRVEYLMRAAHIPGEWIVFMLASDKEQREKLGTPIEDLRKESEEQA